MAPLGSKRTLQLYAFIALNIFIIATINSFVSQRTSSFFRSDGNDYTARLQASLSEGISQISTSISKQTSDYKGEEEELSLPTRVSTPSGVFEELREEIYDKGRRKRQEAFDARKYSLSNLNAIEPFNVWSAIYIWDWFSPDYNCPSMERMGKVGDGGKWICDIDFLKSDNLMSKENKHKNKNLNNLNEQEAEGCIMYAFGVNRDLSFEVELVNRTNCTVHAFDPTVGGVPVEARGNHRIIWHKQALGAESGKPTDLFMLVESLPDIMKRLGHSHIDLLKVDVEGSEWEAFQGIDRQLSSLPFGQLSIELHYEDVEKVFTFFNHLESKGFRIFSRETNHNPCSSGKLPTAVEFSLINPDLYYNRGSTEMAEEIAALPLPSKPNGVVYTLTRRANLQRLYKMLDNFEANFNVAFSYPLVVFHDDLTVADMEDIQSRVTSVQIDFRFIEFEIPSHLDKARIPERCECSPHSSTVGYRHMNRFLAFTASQILAEEYEWQWRLDDDSVINKIVGYDVFRLMEENNKLYGYSNTVMDDPICVDGLWEAAWDYVDTNEIETTFLARWKAGEVFYNNFEVSHRDVWISPEYRQFFEFIDENGGIYYKRWGDAPIRSIGVAMFVEPDQVHHFMDIAYTHLPFIDRQEATGLPSPKESKDLKAIDVDDVDPMFLDKLMLSNNSVNMTALMLLVPFNSHANGVIYMGLPDVAWTHSMDKWDEALAMQDTQLLHGLTQLDLAFNSGRRYPVALFHTGMSMERKHRIRRATSSPIEFYRITLPELPVSVSRSALVAAKEQSDRLSKRCRIKVLGEDFQRFHAYMAVEPNKILAKKYEWHFRLAHDSFLDGKIDYDIFGEMIQKKYKYASIAVFSEDGECTSGFSAAYERFMQKQSNGNHEDDYNGAAAAGKSVFHVGMEVSHRDVWISEEYQTFVSFMTTKVHDFYYQNWDDATLRSAGALMQLKDSEIHIFNNVGYTHLLDAKSPIVKQRISGSTRLYPVAEQLKGVSFTSAASDELDALFAVRRIGYLGGDIATSIRLPHSNDYAWLFGDTYLGASHKTQRIWSQQMVHNAVAILQGNGDGKAPVPGDVDFKLKYNEDGSLLMDIFVSDKQNVVYWPLCGVAVEGETSVQDKLIIIALSVRMFDDDEVPLGLVNFDIFGSTLIVVDNPHDSPAVWKYRAADIINTKRDFNWGAGIANTKAGKETADMDDEVFILGTDQFYGADIFDQKSHNFVGRCSVRQLVDLDTEHCQMLIGGESNKWEAVAAGENFGNEKHIAEPGISESSLTFDSELGVWYMVHVDTFEAQIVLWTSSSGSIEGPWVSTPVYNIPAPFDNHSKFKCYAGKSHPELRSRSSHSHSHNHTHSHSQIVLSYVCHTPENTDELFVKSEESMKTYVPRFVTLKFDENQVSVETDSLPLEAQA